MTATATATDWRRQARCLTANPNTFFPAKGAPVDPARAICQACPVTAQCLAYALANNERFGVWGGTSVNQRRTLTPAPA